MTHLPGIIGLHNNNSAITHATAHISIAEV